MLYYTYNPSELHGRILDRWHMIYSIFFFCLCCYTHMSRDFEFSVCRICVFPCWYILYTLYICCHIVSVSTLIYNKILLYNKYICFHLVSESMLIYNIIIQYNTYICCHLVSVSTLMTTLTDVVRLARSLEGRANKFPTKYTEMISTMCHGLRLALRIKFFCFCFRTLHNYARKLWPPPKKSQGSPLMMKN